MQPSDDPPVCVAWPIIDIACNVNVSAESCASRDTVINDAADATSAHPSSSTTSAPSAIVNLPPTPNASASTTSSAHLCAGLIPADSATAQVVKPPKPSVSPTYPPNIPGPADHMFSPTTPTTLGSLRRTILNGERATIPSSGRLSSPISVPPGGVSVTVVESPSGSPATPASSTSVVESPSSSSSSSPIASPHLLAGFAPAVETSSSIADPPTPPHTYSVTREHASKRPRAL